MKKKITKFPIDLSMLTESEIDQFRDDPTTLFEGYVDVVLYLRFTIGRKSEPDHHSGDGFRSNQKALLTMTVGSAFLHASPEKP